MVLRTNHDISHDWVFGAAQPPEIQSWMGARDDGNISCKCRRKRRERLGAKAEEHLAMVLPQDIGPRRRD